MSIFKKYYYLSIYRSSLKTIFKFTELNVISFSELLAQVVKKVENFKPETDDGISLEKVIDTPVRNVLDIGTKGSIYECNCCFNYFILKLALFFISTLLKCMRC